MWWMHRTTNEIGRRSTTADNTDWAVFPGTEAESLAAAQTLEAIPIHFRVVDGTSDEPREMTEAEKNADLTAEKARRIGLIDARTRELIAEGFTWNTKQLSLSMEAQMNMSFSWMLAGTLTYPYKISTLNDDDIYEVADVAEMQQLVGTGSGIRDGHVIDGRDLKDSILEAQTIAALDLIVDNR
jgi:hypothetical protein